MTDQIEVTDLGPVESLRLKIPTDGGVLVLRGPNDSGKSETLAAVTRLLGGESRITCRDNAAAGEIEGLGVKIRVTRSPRRTGELEAVSLEGTLDLGYLVDPGIDDPDKADLRRIRALVRLTGAQADPAQFYGIIPGGRETFYRIASESTVADSSDLVDLAARLKRDLEKAARSEAYQAANAEAQAAANRQAIEGIDLAAPTDEAALSNALTEAILADAAVNNRRNSAREANKRATEAADQIAAAEASYTGPTYEQARTSAEASHADLEEAKKNEAEALRRLEAAQQDTKAATLAYNRAIQAASIAKQHETILATCRATIATLGAHDDPTEAQITEAVNAVDKARKAAELGVLVRRAKNQAQAATRLQADARAHAQAAEAFREAAKATDDVLSAAVASPALSVRAGRLVTQHPTRGEVYYSERSHGTRWKIAIDEAVRRIRAANVEGLAILIAPQTAWEGLDPTNRRAVADYAKAKRVLIITAQADDGDLRAEQFGANAA